MENQYYLLLNTNKPNPQYFSANLDKKKSTALLTHLYRREGCLVKRLREIDRRKFRNNKLKLPFIVSIRGEKKLLKLLLIAEFVTHYSMLYKSYFVNIENIKSVIVRNYEIDLTKKPALMLLPHLNHHSKNLLIILTKIRYMKEKNGSL